MERTIRFHGWLPALLLVAGCAGPGTVIVTVTNRAGIVRENEMVEIPWGEVTALYPGLEAGQVVVTGEGGEECPSQVLYGGGDAPVALLFPASTGAGETVRYRVTRGTPRPYARQVTGRLVAERLDDFAWENSLVAFRVYGPALEATGEISNGIDAWVKSTPRLVVDEWYERGDYHRDHGEGFDGYKVGRTLGAGAMAPLVDGAFAYGNNFTGHAILDNGPLRVCFALTYAPYRAGETMVTETRVITLDAGSRFNRVEEYYENAPAMEVAAGIVLREGESVTWADTTHGVIAYWEPRNNDNNMDNGHTAIAVIFPGGMKDARQVEGHLAGIADYVPGVPFVYYAGTGWSKGGVETPGAWLQQVEGMLTRVVYPLEITVTRK